MSINQTEYEINLVSFFNAICCEVHNRKPILIINEFGIHMWTECGELEGAVDVAKYLDKRMEEYYEN